MGGEGNRVPAVAVRLQLMALVISPPMAKMCAGQL